MSKKKFFTIKSDPKKGMVGFLIRKGILESKQGAEFFLLLFALACFSAAYLNVTIKIDNFKTVVSEAITVNQENI